MRLGQYCCGIWAILVVAVITTDGVPNNGSNTCFVGLLCMLENVAGNAPAFRRRDEDWVTLVVVTVFCRTVVGAKHVGYVADSCDTDWGLQLRQALMSCSCLHSSTNLFHACSFLIACSVNDPWVLVFHEVGKNPTTFGFNKLAEDAGNGIILGVPRGDDDIFNS